jgi:hypothetical protein
MFVVLGMQLADSQYSAVTFGDFIAAYQRFLVAMES